MKTHLFAALTVFIAAAIPAQAEALFLKATVTGTVQTELETSPTAGHIHTTVLNDKRIFQEFQVSKDDYQLAVSVGNQGSLVLIPKHTSGGLPTITVLGLGNDEQILIDTTAHAANFVSAVDKGTATNLFENLGGEASGTIHFKGSLMAPVITKYSYSFTGHGTDRALSGAALLKFKVTTSGVFTPAP